MSSDIPQIPNSYSPPQGSELTIELPFWYLYAEAAQAENISPTLGQFQTELNRFAAFDASIATAADYQNIEHQKAFLEQVFPNVLELDNVTILSYLQLAYLKDVNQSISSSLERQKQATEIARDTTELFTDVLNIYNRKGESYSDYNISQNSSGTGFSIYVNSWYNLSNFVEPHINSSTLNAEAFTPAEQEIHRIISLYDKMADMKERLQNLSMSGDDRLSSSAQDLKMFIEQLMDTMNDPQRLNIDFLRSSFSAPNPDFSDRLANIYTAVSNIEKWQELPHRYSETDAGLLKNKGAIKQSFQEAVAGASHLDEISQAQVKQTFLSFEEFYRSGSQMLKKLNQLFKKLAQSI